MSDQQADRRRTADDAPAATGHEDGSGTPDGVREAWQPGARAWFEYHYRESPESSDAELWYRSHQQVTVLGRGRDEDWPGTFADRAGAGCPDVYAVRFADGYEGTVSEDELLTGPEHYQRPDPPAGQARLADIRAAGYVTEEWERWQQGHCGTYAAALMILRPGLRLGVIGGGDDTEHYFAHDGSRAYDSAGCHLLPYLGVFGQAEWCELDAANPGIWGRPGDECRPERFEQDIADAMAHALRNRILARAPGGGLATGSRRHEPIPAGRQDGLTPAKAATAPACLTPGSAQLDHPAAKPSAAAGTRPRRAGAAGAAPQRGRASRT